LGMAIVRSIVEMHGGEIEISSVVGEGTVVRITLPRASEKVSDTSREAHPVHNADSVA
ncbi:MAG: Histidine kinase, gyrase and HSP90-like ATPase, partial [Chloroflexota bacterium]|nr:Histidine kinase, gyrase and HSP90-like ATPase [Chloroflexota bacterium]